MNVSAWRGYLAPQTYQGRPVFVVLHGADLFHDPRMFAPTLRDWSKFKALRQGVWPRQLPAEQALTTVLAAEAFKAPFVAIDTEYHAPPGIKWDDAGFRRQDAILDLIGVGWPGSEGDTVVQCFWGSGATEEYEFGRWLKALVREVPVVFQNAMADIPLLQANLGIEYRDYCRIDDLMLAHSVLWSEWPHDLEFLASLYSLYPKTKHLAKTDPLLYNRGDVADTVRCWAGIRPELEADPLVAGVYEQQSLPLVPIILRRQAAGIKTNQDKIREAMSMLEVEQAAATRLARAYTGIPDFNLGSPVQLQRWLYEVEGLPVQLNKKSKNPTIEDEAMVALRETFDPVPDFEEEQRAPLTYEQAVGRVGAGAHPLLEARVIYSGAQQALSHYLRPMLGRERIYPNFALHAQASGRWSITGPPLQQFPRPTTPVGRLIQAALEPDPGEVWIGWDWSSMEPRLEAYQSGEPVLIEAFEKDYDPYCLYTQLMFWGATEETRLAYAQKLFGMWSQPGRVSVPGDDASLVLQQVSELKTGMDRWLEGQGQLSSDLRQRLRAPVGGESWPGRGCTPQEWKQAGQQAGEPGSNDAARAWAGACAAWVVCGGPPPGWLGKDDNRRQFAKRHRLKLSYGGSEKSDTPGRAKLGLSKADLAGAGAAILRGLPKLSAYWKRLQDQALTTRKVRTFQGRLRALLGKTGKAMREALNHPNQGAVADILNLTLVEIHKALPYALVVFTVHDAAWIGVPADRQEEATRAIQGIVTRPWTINGRVARFPADMKLRS